MPELSIDVKTARGGNNREHWRARHKRVALEREATRAVLLRVPFHPITPCRVILTRYGPSNGLDDDNLAGALKSIRDEVAAWLGVDDKRRDVVRYEYEQSRRKTWSVGILFGVMT